MSELLSEEFCFTTRQHYSELLELTKSYLDVDTLVRAIKKTIEIEDELGERFGFQTVEVHILKNIYIFTQLF